MTRTPDHKDNPRKNNHGKAHPRKGNSGPDPSRIHPVFLGSDALSPFHDCYANEDTVLRRAAGRYFAHYNGDDPVKGYWALRQAAALFDVPERPVEISGPDAVPFLEYLTTRRVADMKKGRGRYVLLCTHQGGLLMDGVLFRLAEDRFWLVQPDGDLDTWILAHRHGYDIAVSDPGSRVLQLQGPRSFAIMNAASGGAIGRDFGYFHSGFFPLGGQPVYASRTGWSGELGYEIYTLGDQTDCPRLWSHLMECGGPEGMVFASMQTINIRRIEAGILDSGSDFDTSMTPHAAGLGRFVDRAKNDFIGRASLLDEVEQNRLFGIKTHGGTPKAGDAVLADGTVIGRITTGAFSPLLECGIGYVRLLPGITVEGRTITLASERFGTLDAEITPLPFYDPDKLIPRTIPAST